MILSVSRYVVEKEEQKAAEQRALEEAELAAKAERHQEMVAVMQEVFAQLPTETGKTEEETTAENVETVKEEEI